MKIDEYVNKIICGNALNVLKPMPDEFIDCIVTSPPYWALRDYGVDGQLGLESTFQEYINKLCDIFDEVKRILKPAGTCWVNIGDTYSTQSGAMRDGKFGPKNTNNQRIVQPKPTNTRNHGAGGVPKMAKHLPSKCLLQIPSRFAIEMTNRGWILRNEIIWFKRNCMPSSANDRFTVDFEKLFFFTKNKEYYFEQQFEDLAHSTQNDYRVKNSDFTENRPNRDYAGYAQQGSGMLKPNEKGRNKRCVWDIPPKPCPDAHFAVYPKELCYTPIKAGCPPSGIILDPFGGIMTTAAACINLGRNYLMIELNPEYIKIGERKLSNITPLL